MGRLIWQSCGTLILKAGARRFILLRILVVFLIEDGGFRLLMVDVSPSVLRGHSRVELINRLASHVCCSPHNGLLASCETGWFHFELVKDLSLRSCIHAEVLLHTLIDWDIRSFLVLNVDILERLIIILANADTEQIVRLAR